GLAIGHIVGRDQVCARKVSDRIFGNAARRRRHDAVARLEAGDLAADRLNIARAFEPDPRADAADTAMPIARRYDQIGAVERGSAYADQYLVGLGHRFFKVENFDPDMAQYGGFHSNSPCHGRSFLKLM